MEKEKGAIAEIRLHDLAAGRGEDMIVPYSPVPDVSIHTLSVQVFAAVGGDEDESGFRALSNTGDRYVVPVIADPASRGKQKDRGMY